MKERQQDQLINSMLSDPKLGPMSLKEIRLSDERRKPQKNGRRASLVAGISLTFGEGDAGFTRYWFEYNNKETSVIIMVKYHPVNDNTYDLAYLDGQIRWHSTRELVIKRAQVMVEFKSNLIKMLLAKQITG